MALPSTCISVSGHSSRALSVGGLELHTQGSNPWCWVACIASVVGVGSTSPYEKYCSVASKALYVDELTKPDCCRQNPKPVDQPCLETLNFNEVTSAWGNFDLVARRYSHHAARSWDQRRHHDLVTLAVDSVANGVPCQLGVVWRDAHRTTATTTTWTRGHLVMAQGVMFPSSARHTGPVVTVLDSAMPAVVQWHSRFLDTYWGGSVEDAWRVLRSTPIP